MKKRAKDAVIEFMINKNEIIFDDTGVNLLDQEDFKDLWNWDNEIFIGFYTSVKDSKGEWYDAGICPWCYKNDMDCSVCEYGKRHGECVFDGNRYNEVCDKYGAILDFPGMFQCVYNFLEEVE